MRKIQIVGLALAAVFAFSVVASASASAAEWLVSGAAITGTEKIGVNSKTETGKPLALEDMGTGVAITCEGTDKGFLLSGGKSEETEVTENLASCAVTAGSGTCKKILAVKAVNLSWAVNLTGVEEASIKELTGGAAGWLVECEGPFGIKVDDTCTTNLGTVLVHVEPNGSLHVEFMEGEPESKWANCSVGGNLKGLVSGLIFIESVSGLALSIS